MYMYTHPKGSFVYKLPNMHYYIVHVHNYPTALPPPLPTLTPPLSLPFRKNTEPRVLNGPSSTLAWTSSPV